VRERKRGGGGVGGGVEREKEREKERERESTNNIARARRERALPPSPVSRVYARERAGERARGVSVQMRASLPPSLPPVRRCARALLGRPLLEAQASLKPKT